MGPPHRLFLPLFAVALSTAVAGFDHAAAFFRMPGEAPSFHYLNIVPYDSPPSEPARFEWVSVRQEESVPDRFEEIGQASWYGAWHQGRPTASGEPFDMHKLTAAHRSLPLGTNVRVTNLKNGRSVDVTINDRGPYVDGRVIDLSRHAARVLHMEKAGLAPVIIEELPDAAVAKDNRAAKDDRTAQAD